MAEFVQTIMARRNYREEIETALAGGRPEHVPFTIYDGMTRVDGVDFAPLHAQGLALCCRRGVFECAAPNVTQKVVDEPGGVKRTVLQTPVGEISRTWKVGAYDAGAPLDHYVKSPDDYHVVEFIVKDRRYTPAYDDFIAAERKIGDAGKVIAGTVYSPLLEIQLGWLGQERFCYDIADNFAAVMELYELTCRSQEPMYDIVADGPAQWVLYGGNIVPEMLGPSRVRDYVLPCWRRFADRLHARGKKMGVHLDANNLAISDIIRQSPLDFIEAFTPPPDCNVSVEQARRDWPDKRLWINFPSSVHLADDARIREVTLEILRQAGDRRGFLMGITENIPNHVIARSLAAILRALAE
ncbi:MAG: hypothetical protein ACE15C_03770 [Phycisphaerae bacterium]